MHGVSKMEKNKRIIYNPKERGGNLLKISNMETERCVPWSLEELMTHSCVHVHIIFLAKTQQHGNLEKLTYRDHLLCQGSERTLF